MPLDPGFVGREYPPTEPYEVSREKIREFADAVGDPNPAYRRSGAAAGYGHPDVVAPPTFPVVVAERGLAQLVADRELGLDFSRVVHGAQRFAHARPVRAGDRLVVVQRIDQIRHLAGNDVLSTSADIRTTDGETVSTAYQTLVVRGGDDEGDQG